MDVFYLSPGCSQDPAAPGPGVPLLNGAFIPTARSCASGGDRRPPRCDEPAAEPLALKILVIKGAGYDGTLRVRKCDKPLVLRLGWTFAEFEGSDFLSHVAVDNRAAPRGRKQRKCAGDGHRSTQARRSTSCSSTAGSRSSSAS